MTYIKDIVKPGDIIPRAFNLIDAGCGTGKTTFCTEGLFSLFPGLKPEEIVFATSRSIVANQMTQNKNVQVERAYIPEDCYNKNDPDLAEISRGGISVMTYDVFAKCFAQGYGDTGRPAFCDKKVIVVDECHALLTDRFIAGIDLIISGLRMIINYTDCIVIGLTATAGIFYRYGPRLLSPVHRVCAPIPTNHPAKHLVYTRMEMLPELFSRGKLESRSIILAPTIRDCQYLQERIPNSAILMSQGRKYTQATARRDAAVRKEFYFGKCSASVDFGPVGPVDPIGMVCSENAKNKALPAKKCKGKRQASAKQNTDLQGSWQNKKNPATDVVYEKYMDDIRSRIVNSQTIPEYIYVRDHASGKQEKKKLDVLISTTTLREGFSLVEESGVRNVICCFPDDVHVTQFLGRCRYQVDCLVVAPPAKLGMQHPYKEYFDAAMQSYDRLWKGSDDTWLESVQALLAEPIASAQRFETGIRKQPKSFEALVRAYCDGHKLYYEDLKQIQALAFEARIFRTDSKRAYSIPQIRAYFKGMGYELRECGRARNGGKGSGSDRKVYQIVCCNSI